MLHQAQVNLGYTTIISPIDGTVISRNVDVGQTVAASFQAPTLFVIAQDLRHMQVDTNVGEADVGRLTAGMTATFTVDAYPTKQFIGKLRQIRNAAQTLQNVVTYDAVIDVENPDLLLRPGMTANVVLRRRAKGQRRAPAQCRVALRSPIRSSSRASASPIRAQTLLRRKTPIARRSGCFATASRCACRFHRRYRRNVDGAGAGRRPARRCADHRHDRESAARSVLDAGDSAMPPLIQLEHVTKIYRMGDVTVTALRDVSLTIDEGEFVAIMGASGSGKSTLMNIIGCLDGPTSGRYLLGRHAVSDFDRNTLAEVRNRMLGFVFQNFNLLPRTSALEQVELPMLYAGVPAAERHRRAAAALTRVGLGDRLDHRPNQLSGGQQQRVALARAMVMNPRVILADEPTGNLDSRTSMEVMALFQELGRAGITIVLVTHEAGYRRARRALHRSERWADSFRFAACAAPRGDSSAARNGPEGQTRPVAGRPTSESFAHAADRAAGPAAQQAALVSDHAGHHHRSIRGHRHGGCGRRRHGARAGPVCLHRHEYADRSAGRQQQGGAFGGFGTQPTLTWDDLKAMRTEVPTVRYAAALLHKAMQVQSEDHNWNTSVNGTSPDYFAIRDWAAAKGSLFTDSPTWTAQTKNAVLGQTVVRQAVRRQLRSRRPNHSHQQCALPGDRRARIQGAIDARAG